MIHIEITPNNEATNGRANVLIEGDLGNIYRELALAVKLISDNEELEISVDEVFEMIKESMSE